MFNFPFKNSTFLTPSLVLVFVCQRQHLIGHIQAVGLPLRSLRLGLVGQADIVEFHPNNEGSVTPFPVEYKRGKPKPGHWDEVQLCAQALCLEEMLTTSVPAGAIFYGEPRRRTDVQFGQSLRMRTEALTSRLHLLQAQGTTPIAEYAPKCNRCSLREVFLPEVT